MASRAIAARNRLANACRHKRDEPEITNAKRELAAAKIADNVEKVLSQAPPLTADQRERIAALLRAGGAGSAPASDRQAAVTAKLAELGGEAA